MNFFITFLIFIIILFIYVHINDQYKKSEDLEIYELDYISNNELQNICNIKQPVLFEFQEIYPDIFTKMKNMDFIEKGENLDIKVKDVLDYWNPNITTVDPVILQFSSFETLIKSDPKGHFFMEDNQDFLEETDILNEIRELDTFLKPTFNANSKYDLLLGSNGCVTPLRFHTDYRRFLIVTTGKISIKMTPFKSRKYLQPVVDYDNYDFYSKLNCWDSHSSEMNKLKFLEFEVTSGYVLYIPPYWWYSIKFYSDTQIVDVHYQTIMNICSNIPDLFRYYLQFHNTKVKIARTLDIDKDNNKDDNQNNDIPTDNGNII